MLGNADRLHDGDEMMVDGSAFRAGKRAGAVGDTGRDVADLCFEEVASGVGEGEVEAAIEILTHAALADYQKRKGTSVEGDGQERFWFIDIFSDSFGGGFAGCGVWAGAAA